MDYWIDDRELLLLLLLFMAGRRCCSKTAISNNVFHLFTNTKWWSNNRSEYDHFYLQTFFCGNWSVNYEISLLIVLCITLWKCPICMNGYHDRWVWIWVDAEGNEGVWDKNMVNGGLDDGFMQIGTSTDSDGYEWGWEGLEGYRLGYGWYEWRCWLGCIH